jgi:glutamate-1-semialdehyde 2,1-aminomutase
MNQHDNSQKLFTRAQKTIPGGVNSPVRAFKSMGGNPVFFKSGKGPFLYDVDGNEYIDYVSSWGPLILGYCHPRVVAAIQKQAEKASSFGAPTEMEVEMAELICQWFPSIEMVRMVNSGTEATMSAIRLARAYTKRNKIVKFAGCYHGHADSFLIQAGSGAMTLGIPNSPGVCQSVAADTLIARYNDFASIVKLFDAHAQDIAAIIVEPILGNAGVVLPKEGFLQQLRDITKKHGALLIFDEVITGFRVAKGGAQELYKIAPDLTTLGKIIGGGLPVGAYGGRRDIMQMIAPLGPVYQAGTLSGNPLAMSAGLETLRIIAEDKEFHKKLETKTARLCAGIQKNLDKFKIPAATVRVGSMGCLFFTSQPVTDYESACQADAGRYKEYFWHMLNLGIYLAPSQYEAFFLSAAHGDAEIDKTIAISAQALEKIAKK